MQLKKTALVLSIGIAVAQMTGCSTYNTKDFGGDVELKQTKTQIHELVEHFKKNPSYTRIPISGIKAQAAVENPSSSILNRKFNKLSADGIDLFTALSVDLDGVTIIADESIKDLPLYIKDFKGTLHEFLDGLQKTSGVFYSVDNNTLHLSKTQKFYVKFPPNFQEELSKTVSENFTEMGATGVYFNPIYSTVSYTADFSTQQNIDRFLKDIEKGLKTLVFDTWLWEVDITNSENTGVNFNAVNLGKDVVLTGGFQNPPSGGLGINVKTNFKDSINFDGIISLLKSTGKLSTLSHPTLTMMSGSTAKFELATQHLYISKVTTTGDIISGGSTVSTGSVGIETAELKTGLQLEVSGRYYQDSVFTKLKMDLSDALPNDEVDISGVKVSLPNTFTRKYESDARIKVGNYYLVAGINYRKNSTNIDGLPTLSENKMIPTAKVSSDSNIELVMLMRPRVVEFYRATKEVNSDYDKAHALKYSGVLDQNAKPVEKPKASTLSASKILDIKKSPDAAIAKVESKDAVSTEAENKPEKSIKVPVVEVEPAKSIKTPVVEVKPAKMKDLVTSKTIGGKPLAEVKSDPEKEFTPAEEETSSVQDFAEIFSKEG